MKLLIVDGNAAVRRLIRGIVASFADEIHECANGMDALAAYVAHTPDLVLMDMAMEKLDGIAATKEIRLAHPAAKIIIVADYDDLALREAAWSAGACGYVPKENLLDLVRLLEAYRDSNSDDFQRSVQERKDDYTEIVLEY